MMIGPGRALARGKLQHIPRYSAAACLFLWSAASAGKTSQHPGEAMAYASHFRHCSACMLARSACSITSFWLIVHQLPCSFSEEVQCPTNGLTWSAWFKDIRVAWIGFDMVKCMTQAFAQWHAVIGAGNPCNPQCRRGRYENGWLYDAFKVL